MGGGGGGQQPVTQQTTQTRDPWSAAQPFLTSAMGQASNLWQGGVGYIPYSGNTTAPLNEAMQTGLSRGIGLAEGEPFGSENLAGARSYLADLIAKQGLSAPLQSMASTLAGQANPYLQGALNQQMDKVNSAMSGAGRYGSGAHSAAIAQAIAPTLAQDYLPRQGMATNIYGQGLQRAGQATETIPALDAARYASTDALLNYGGVQRGYDQALLDQQLKYYNATQSYPWEQLARANAIYGQAGGLGG